MTMFRGILSEMRVRQYTKNALVFASALFNGNLFEPSIFLRCLTAFAAFSLTASMVYVFNDIIDRDSDRLHPVKCKRPIASGALAVSAAYCIAILSGLISLLLAWPLGLRFLVILGLYVIMNGMYSKIFKSMVLMDVMVLAAGFILRALAGVVAAEAVISAWFILCVFMLSLFLALGKRRSELQGMKGEAGNTRKVLRHYSTRFLDALLSITTAMALTCYSFFALSAQHHEKWLPGGLPMMSLTIPLVVYGMFRYLYLIYIFDKGERPEEILLRDGHILGTCGLFFVFVFYIRNV